AVILTYHVPRGALSKRRDERAKRRGRARGPGPALAEPKKGRESNDESRGRRESRSFCTIIDTMENGTGGDEAKETSTTLVSVELAKDELRGSKRKRNEFETMVRDANTVLELVEDDPSLLGTKLFKGLREKIHRIADNPSKYPRTLEVRGWGKTYRGSNAQDSQGFVPSEPIDRRP
ncbi:hypothetical protein THAOC_17400, partial [Thalassiosira oceanica]